MPVMIFHSILTQITQTVDDLKDALIRGKRVTFQQCYNNFDLYRNDFANDVREHIKPSAKIRDFFPEKPDIDQVHVLIYLHS